MAKKKYKEYEVKKFDSLLSIASEQNVDFKKLAYINDLSQVDNYKIKIGQILKLPIIIDKEESKKEPTEE